MSCMIEIDSIVGIRSTQDQPPFRIEIWGNSEDCRSIEVRVTVNRESLQPVVVSPTAPSGDWRAIFEEGTHYDRDSIRCGRATVQVNAVCVEDSNCKAEEKYRMLECKVEGSVCPTLEDLSADVSDQCNDDGTRTVTVSSRISTRSSDNVFIQWRHDDNNGAANVLTSAGIYQDSFDYVADGNTHTACLQVLHPQGCESPCISFDVTECQAEVRCPSIQFTSVQISDDCNPDNTRTVNISVEATGPSGAPVSAEMVDDNGTILASGISSTNIVQLQATHDFQPGFHLVSIRIITPSGCPSGEINLEIEKCDERPPTPTPDPTPANGENGGIPWCLIWFWINIALVIVAGVSVFVAACSAEPVAIGTAIGLVVASIVSFILWGVFCASSMCVPLIWFIDILVAVTPIAAIIGIILVASGIASCGIGGFLEAGYLGTILAISYYIARIAGCLVAVSSLGNISRKCT